MDSYAFSVVYHCPLCVPVGHVWFDSLRFTFRQDLFDTAWIAIHVRFCLF